MRVLLVALMLVLAAPSLAGGPAPRTLSWDDLIPPNAPQETEDAYVKDDKAMSGFAYNPSFFPVNPALDGKTVRIPGYAVPLTFDGTEVKDFLLVPFLGACIHVPPPPPNQVVFVRNSRPLTDDELSDPVWVSGVLSAENNTSDLAQSGYVLGAAEIRPYTE